MQRQQPVAAVAITSDGGVPTQLEPGDGGYNR
jgi:hypothetical protein